MKAKKNGHAPAIRDAVLYLRHAKRIIVTQKKLDRVSLYALLALDALQGKL